VPASSSIARKPELLIHHYTNLITIDITSCTTKINLQRCILSLDVLSGQVGGNYASGGSGILDDCTIVHNLQLANNYFLQICFSLLYTAN
jgi:hypothetical protein